MALYARLVVAAAARRGWQPHVLTTERAARHPSFRLVEAAAAGSLHTHFMPPVAESSRTDTLSLLARQYAYFRSMQAGISAITPAERPERVYVANLDYCDKVMSVLGSPFGALPVSGLMMSIRFHQHEMGTGPRSRNDRLYALLFRRLLRLRSIYGIAAIDEPFFEYASRTGLDRQGKLAFVPDPGELSGSASQAEAREALGIGVDRFVLLVYGNLSTRKGIRELLRAVTAGQLPEATVLLAGVPDPSVRDLLQEPESLRMAAAGQLVVHIGFCDQEKEYLAFRAADTVWVAYVGGFSGSSGVLYQACSIGAPVIGPRSGLLQWLIEKHGIGLCCEPADLADAAAAIRALADQPDLRATMAANGLRLARDHTGERFGEAVCDLIAR